MIRMVTHELTKKPVQRCPWCLRSPLYIDYHDNEWGKAVYDDERLFAMLCLESMQAGLSWLTILQRKENYYHAFDQFNAEKIAQYDDKKINQLMQNQGIIRHRGKILAIINNAKAYLRIKQQQSFCTYLWKIATPDGKPIINHIEHLDDVPTQTPSSQKLAKQLKKDGFIFIGATTCYAFMQACGMVNDHLNCCDFK